MSAPSRSARAKSSPSPTSSDALSALPEKARPHFVRVVDEIPVTTWYRPITAPLKALGVPDGKKGVAYRLNSDGGYNKVAKPKPKPKEKASA